ncbi:GGDEF domain-containing protein [Vibrio alginolyticus]|nr:GGDEF domain-containing protein [Vibrio alginolyticus]
MSKSKGNTHARSISLIDEQNMFLPNNVGLKNILKKISDLEIENQKLTNRVLLLEKRLSVDFLTGLSSRAQGITHIESLIQDNDIGTFSLVFIDLDQLKKINDSAGHVVGDRMIERLGNILKKMQLPKQTIARFGGDEFIAILPNYDHQKTTSWCNCLQKRTKLQEPIRIDGQHFYLSVSVGSYVYHKAREPEHLDAKQLIERADKDMYKNKQSKNDSLKSYIYKVPIGG